MDNPYSPIGDSVLDDVPQAKLSVGQNTKGCQISPEKLLKKAVDILAASNVLVLSGAGISTDSGIPDYRGPESSKRKHNPIKHREFTGNQSVRRRYWARSSIGWPKVRDARPNEGHIATAQLGKLGLAVDIITQNVDGLHQAGGSRNVLELHGSLHDVLCLDCGNYESRDSVQNRLMEVNPGWTAAIQQIAPDGDVDLPREAEEGFRIVDCRLCGGVLKPDVVFFGDSVPKGRVERAWRTLEKASSILVLGSSLTVFSGYRFVREAARQGKPIVIINDGTTRGDVHAHVKFDSRIVPLFPAIVTRLGYSLTASRKEYKKGDHASFELDGIS